MFCKPDSCYKKASFLLPSTGPNRWLIKPSGVTIAWYFMQCFRFHPLKQVHWWLVGRAIPCIVPSINPHTVPIGAPLRSTAWAYSKSFSGVKRILSQSNTCPQRSWISCCVVVEMREIRSTDHPNFIARSLNLFGYVSRANNMQSAVRRSSIIRFSAITISGSCKAFTSNSTSSFVNLIEFFVSLNLNYRFKYWRHTEIDFSTLQHSIC